MGLFEKRIEIDLGESNFFELSDASRRELDPPDLLAERWKRAQKEGAAQELPELVVEVSSAVFDEFRTIIDAANLMATKPSPEVFDKMAELVAEHQDPELSR